MRMHSNIAEVPSRLLKKTFDNAGTAAGTAKAMGLNAPTKRSDSMGLTGHNGIVSFICSDGGNQVYTLYEWNAKLARVNSGNGWVLNGAAAAEYARTADEKAKISFTCSEQVPFYIKAGTTPVTNLIVSGSEDQQGIKTDQTYGI
jgi:hypothetical protein